jgi:hypothetical protein
MRCKRGMEVEFHAFYTPVLGRMKAETDGCMCPFGEFSPLLNDHRRRFYCVWCREKKFYPCRLSLVWIYPVGLERSKDSGVSNLMSTDQLLNVPFVHYFLHRIMFRQFSSKSGCEFACSKYYIK